MTDRPIPFSTEMVQALLAGRKNMTRRVLKPQPEVDSDGMIRFKKGGWFAPHVWQAAMESADICPAYTPGDRLYVREPWQALAMHDDKMPSQIPAGSDILYVADRPDMLWDARKRHARFMCRWMSRLTLIVTDVRVERVQDISEEDAVAEGLESRAGDGTGPGAGYKWDGIGYHAGSIGRWGKHYHTPQADGQPGCACNVGGSTPAQCAFRELWDRIHKPGFQFDDNPWICALRFTVHHCNIDAMGQAA